MPPDRRRRRFRRPGTGRWLTESFPTLRIELAVAVRNTLTAWMRLYGEANNVPGLATGPIETRFARLRDNCAADSLIVWTTPTRWAAGEGLSLRFPQLHLEFSCSLGDGHLVATKVSQVAEDARPPEREPGAVGVVVRAERIPLPPDDADSFEPDPGVDILEQHFARLAGRRWGGFAAPLRAALEAEASEDEARTQRLTVPFKEAALTRGGEEDVWRLKGVAADALRALDDGEWLEILDEQGRSRTSARVIDTHPGAGTLLAGVRTASDPPRSGFVRPRSRRKILEQKRALLEELASPTGSLPNLVRLVAAPASMPTPHQVRPPRFVNPAVVRNRSQARAVSLALGLEEGQALLIQGPPGTGKSTTAAEIDVQLILRDPGVRILVCSHSNHGTDNMLMKVLPFLPDAADRIARIGFYERIAKDARPYYASADADLGDRNIIFTTIDALVLQDIAGATVYDYVILDEANRAGVLDSLLALARGKRMILVGDPMQLQPVMSEAEQQIVAAANGRNGHRGRSQLVGVAQPGAQNVIGKSLFAWIQERRFAPAAAVLLDQQNRMHPAIGELVSRVFYSGRVRTGPAAPRRGTGLPAFPSPVTWVDTRSLRGNVESRAGGTSLFNVAEARLVTSITRHLASNAPPNLTIGVITAYAEQRDLLRRLMGPHDWPPERQLEIDTVDAFEGREKDIIVLSLVRANRRRDIGFLRLEQRLNVAVSRSRRLIIIVGDTSTLRQGYFHHLVATASSVGQIVPAPKLIGMLLHRQRRPRPAFEPARPVLDAAGQPVLDAAGQPVLAGTGRPVLNAEGRPVLDEEGRPVVEAAGEGVPPAAAPGREGPAPAGSRRRRRRAWERRRERLRQLEEQRQAEAAQFVEAEGREIEPAEPPVPARRGRRGRAIQRGLEAGEGRGLEAAEPRREVADVESGAPRVPARRGRRRRVAEPAPPAEAAASLTVAGAEPALTGTPAVEPPPPSRRRRRATAAPGVPEPAAEVPEVPVDVLPARRGRRAAVPALAQPAAATPELPAAAPAPRRGRRAVVAPGQPMLAETVAATTEAPAAAPALRRRRAAGATDAYAAATEPVAPAPAASEPPPSRRGRAAARAVGQPAPAGPLEAEVGATETPRARRGRTTAAAAVQPALAETVAATTEVPAVPRRRRPAIVQTPAVSTSARGRRPMSVVPAVAEQLTLSEPAAARGAAAEEAPPAAVAKRARQRALTTAPEVSAALAQPTLEAQRATRRRRAGSPEESRPSPEPAPAASSERRRRNAAELEAGTAPPPAPARGRRHSSEAAPAEFADAPARRGRPRGTAQRDEASPQGQPGATPAGGDAPRRGRPRKTAASSSAGAPLAEPAAQAAPSRAPRRAAATTSDAEATRAPGARTTVRRRPTASEQVENGLASASEPDVNGAPDSGARLRRTRARASAGDAPANGVPAPLAKRPRRRTASADAN